MQQALAAGREELERRMADRFILSTVRALAEHGLVSV